MSQTPMRHRIFAGMGAALFLLTASALTIAVVYDMVTNKSDTTAKTDTAATCSPNDPVATTETIAAPNAYIAKDAVTQLETTDLEQGSGAAAKSGDCLQMKYYGTLASTGAMFDENYTLKTLLQFQLGVGQVIPGWDQGLVGMKAGGTRRVVIPAVLAYGSQAQGSIPANSDLVFMVKLVKIKS